MQRGRQVPVQAGRDGRPVRCLRSEPLRVHEPRVQALRVQRVWLLRQHAPVRPCLRCLSLQAKRRGETV